MKRVYRVYWTRIDSGAECHEDNLTETGMIKRVGGLATDPYVCSVRIYWTEKPPVDVWEISAGSWSQLIEVPHETPVPTEAALKAIGNAGFVGLTIKKVATRE